MNMRYLLLCLAIVQLAGCDSSPQSLLFWSTLVGGPSGGAAYMEGYVYGQPYVPPPRPQRTQLHCQTMRLGTSTYTDCF